MTDHPEATPEPPEAGTTPPPSRPGFPWRLLLFLVLIVLVVVFAIQNTQSVELRFMGWAWELPLVIIILVAVVVSILLDQILGGYLKRRGRRRRQDREELRRFRDEG